MALEQASRQYRAESLYHRVTAPVLLVVARPPKPTDDQMAEMERQGYNFTQELEKAERHASTVANHKLKRGQIALIQDTSHWIQQDQPEALVAAIESFLSS